MPCGRFGGEACAPFAPPLVVVLCCVKDFSGYFIIYQKVGCKFIENVKHV